MNAALRSTLEALGHELDQKAIRVEIGLGGISPVACHPAKINQVFYHVLLNAIQASERGGVIETRTRPEGDGTVLVEVRDHGGGIAPEHLPHIFEPFFTTKPVGDGTGLGLSVSYGIVRDHGGSLEVEHRGRAGQRLPDPAPARTFGPPPFDVNQPRRAGRPWRVTRPGPHGGGCNKRTRPASASAMVQSAAAVATLGLGGGATSSGRLGTGCAGLTDSSATKS